MPTPLDFQDQSPRHALPYLFTAQAQKEILINEALARIDTLMHPAVSGARTDPPAAPEEGECWIVAAAATGSWAGRDDSLAGFVAGDWLFVSATKGMTCWDSSIDGLRIYNGAWTAMASPTIPSGGTNVDVESRLALTELVNTLTQAGILSV